MRATDDGSPSLMDSKSFTIAVLARPMILSASIANGLITLSWSAIPGQTYRVQSKNDLSDANWTDLADVPASGVTASLMDSVETEAGPVPQKFYRVLVVQ